MIYQRLAMVLGACLRAGATSRASRGWLRWRWLMPALLTGLAATPARADIWGYVDVAGNGHFSSVQLDERYEIFLRGDNSIDDSLDEARAAVTEDENLPARVVKPPARLKVSFELSPSYKAVRHLIREASATHGIDYELLQAVIATESGFNTRAVSPKGAIGLMQLIPPTAARYGVKDDKDSLAEKKLTDPKTNIRAGSRYLNYLIKLFPGQIELAIAAYNAGEGAVKRAGNKIPNYPETRNYVKTVMQLYRQLKPLSGPGAAPAVVATTPTSLITGRSTGRVRVEMMGGTSGLPDTRVSSVLNDEP